MTTSLDCNEYIPVDENFYRRIHDSNGTFYKKDNAGGFYSSNRPSNTQLETSTKPTKGNLKVAVVVIAIIAIAAVALYFAQVKWGVLTSAFSLLKAGVSWMITHPFIVGVTCLLVLGGVIFIVLRNRKSTSTQEGDTNANHRPIHTPGIVRDTPQAYNPIREQELEQAYALYLQEKQISDQMDAPPANREDWANILARWDTEKAVTKVNEIRALIQVHLNALRVHGENGETQRIEALLARCQINGVDLPT